MTIFFNGSYRIVNHPEKQSYHAAIATFNKRAHIHKLFTADKKPIEFDISGLHCGDLLSIIPKLSERGIHDFFMVYTTCKGMSATGLLPVFSVPTGFQPKSSPVVSDVRRYLGMSLAQIQSVNEVAFVFDKPTFNGEFDRDSAISVIAKMKASAAVDLPSVNAIVFECSGVCGYIYYGENPRAEMLEFMEFDIDDGFINKHGDDPISKIVSAELQKFFIAWKGNNYQDKPIPDSTALILSAPMQSASKNTGGKRDGRDSAFEIFTQPALNFRKLYSQFIYQTMLKYRLDQEKALSTSTCYFMSTTTSMMLFASCISRLSYVQNRMPRFCFPKIPKIPKIGIAALFTTAASFEGTRRFLLHNNVENGYRF